MDRRYGLQIGSETLDKPYLCDTTKGLSRQLLKDAASLITNLGLLNSLLTDCPRFVSTSRTENHAYGVKDLLL